MEDVSDAIFRKICRDRGASLCVTEFVNVEGLLRGCKKAAAKIRIQPDDLPTAIQIYGADEARLAEAAEVAEAAAPSYIDINCGCWVPKISRRGAGAGWLRRPDLMIAMAKMVVERVSLPVTVKTRIGWGPESEMPIVDLARRLEDVGVSALTIHCRTANMGHSGAADWSWAQKARQVVNFPVIVNGDIVSGETAKQAFDETGCEGLMVGRAAIDHPWVFREINHYLEHGEVLPGPTVDERIDLCLEHLQKQKEARGEYRAVRGMRRYYNGYLRGLRHASAFRRELNLTDEYDKVVDAIEAFRARAKDGTGDVSGTFAIEPAVSCG